MEIQSGNTSIFSRTKAAKDARTWQGGNDVMNRGSRYLSSLLLAAAFLAPAVATGCATRRYHDPYYNDYHRWNHNEDVYYHQWIVENHRDYRDFRRLNRDDQKRYWDWRHSHHDDHDHDRDHDRH